MTCDVCFQIIIHFSALERRHLLRTTRSLPLLTCECVVEDVVLLQQAPPTIEDANSALFSVVDLVPLEDGVAVCLDPHAGQRVAVDVVLFQNSLSRVVDEHSAIFPSEYLVPLDCRIAASPGGVVRGVVNQQ